MAAFPRLDVGACGGGAVCYREGVPVTTMALKLLRVPANNEPVVGWHVSPLVDVAAYHFSWLLILVPLAIAGDAHPGDYLGLWAFGITISFLHRHVTMPYVYLDGAVFRSFKTRFTLVPAVLLCGFVASVMLQRTSLPAHFFTALDIGVFGAGVGVVVALWWRDRQQKTIADRVLVTAALPFVLATVGGGFGLFRSHHVAAVLAVAATVIAAAVVVGGARIVGVVITLVFAGILLHAQLGGLNEAKLKGGVVVGAAAMLAALWNIWHTAAQKVGILRVYNAKSVAPVPLKVPLWVDRLLVLGWFPLLGPLLVTRERETILTQGKVVRLWLEPVVDGITWAAPALIPIGVVVVVGSLGVFLRYEHRATGLRSAPRLSMALGMTLLSASFLFFNPLKCYVAYGFSHAIEYVVFVWAFQRRRYAVPHDPPPLLQRILRYGWAFYGCFVLLIAGSYFYVEFGATFGLYDAKLTLLGFKASTWLYAWAIWHSLAHFYFDGFLWKMRAPALRASL